MLDAKLCFEVNIFHIAWFSSHILKKANFYENVYEVCLLMARIQMIVAFKFI